MLHIPDTPGIWSRIFDNPEACDRRRAVGDGIPSRTHWLSFPWCCQSFGVQSLELTLFYRGSVIYLGIVLLHSPDTMLRHAQVSFFFLFLVVSPGPFNTEVRGDIIRVDQSCRSNVGAIGGRATMSCLGHCFQEIRLVEDLFDESESLCCAPRFLPSSRCVRSFVVSIVRANPSRSLGKKCRRNECILAFRP